MFASHRILFMLVLIIEIFAPSVNIHEEIHKVKPIICSIIQTFITSKTSTKKLCRCDKDLHDKQYVLHCAIRKKAPSDIIIDIINGNGCGRIGKGSHIEVPAYPRT